MNTLSNEQEAKDIYTNMCKDRAQSLCPEADRILHLIEFYRYMLDSEWDLVGKTKVDDSYLFHMVWSVYDYNYSWMDLMKHMGPNKMFVLMPRGR